VPGERGEGEYQGKRTGRRPSVRTWKD